MKLKLLSAGATTAIVIALAAPASAASIILNNLGGVEQGTRAFSGFTTAANFWGSMISNDITIRLDVGFQHLGKNILGSTRSSLDGELTQDIEGQLAVNARSSIDALAVANLPTLTPSQFGPGVGGISMITPGYTQPGGAGIDNSTHVLDSDGSLNNIALNLTTANSKALGFLGDDGSSDASIQFSPDFKFDFNPRDGIASDSIDFVGVAIHEIGHALGFVSGVDTYDILGLPNGPLKDSTVCGVPCQDYNANNDFFGKTLDLFRYSALGVRTPTWVPGVASYFSLDGGLTSLGGFSTGEFNGDTWQASHWQRKLKGQAALGIMDPAVSDGQQDVVTNLDFTAFDAIGYNLNFDPGLQPHSFTTAQISREFFSGGVPEPDAWMLMIAGFGMVGAATRRQRRRAPAA